MNPASRHIETLLPSGVAGPTTGPGTVSFNDNVSDVTTNSPDATRISLTTGEVSLSATTVLDPLTALWQLAQRADMISFALPGGSDATYWVALAGTFNVTATVDPLNIVPESNDTNNARTAVMTVGTVTPPPPPQQPDVIITAVDFNPKDASGNAVIGAPITWSATIQNIGSGPTPQGTPPYPDGGAGNHRVTWYVNGTLVNFGDSYNGPLAPGGTQTVFSTGGPSATSTWLVAGTAGPVTVEARFDEAQLIAESNETNNNFDKTVTLAAGAGGGGGGTGTRYFDLWPGAVTNPFNYPLGDGTTFDNNQPLNNNNFLPAPPMFYDGIVQEDYAFVPTTWPPTDQEYHYQYCQADHKSWVDHFGWSGVQPPWLHPNVVLGPYDITGQLNNIGSEAARFGMIWGTLRQFDIQQGVIRHALNVFVTRASLKLTFVWPAFGVDGSTTGYGGAGAPFSIGQRIGIPKGVAKPAGITNPLVSMLWDCFQTYGGIITNSSGNPTIKMESTTIVANAINAARSSGQVGLVTGAVRACTNVTQANIAGPASGTADRVFNTPLAPAGQVRTFTAVPTPQS